MRITTWNINGLRTLRQYRPWYSLKDWQACLNYLEADIICFQEVKLTRKALVTYHRDMCVPDGYEAYYNLHPTKGYSGVATFVKKDVCHVRKAEMGLTGELVQNKSDSQNCIGGYPDVRAPELSVYDQIDQEGRAVVVDCGLFVLFNLYCPNETDEGRREYKMGYYYTLAERVENLLANGREVIIVGDLNIAHLPIDHCEGVNQRTRQEHLDIHPARQWLDQFLIPNGAFHDVTRKHHPSRKFMYTCWDTVKDTRPANYGVRIDYTLVSKGLMPWVKGADIQANIYGSDHCPVYVDFHDEIQLESGKTVKLKDTLLTDPNTKRKLPSLATNAWPEFSGRRIQSFFAPKPSTTPSPSPAPNTQQSPSPISSKPAIPEAEGTKASFAHSNTTSTAVNSQNPAGSSMPTSTTPVNPKDAKTDTSNSGTKLSSPARKINGDRKSSVSGKTNGQTNLRSFFSQPTITNNSQDSLSTMEDEVRESNREQEAKLSKIPIDSSPIKDQSAPSPDLSRGEGADSYEDTNSANRVTSALAWGSIFAPKQPPLCNVHHEPAKAWTVNKPGPNHGRKFWMCSRPVGSGGTGNPNDDLKYRCSFWKWDSDIRARQSRLDRDDVGEARSFHEVAGKAPRLGSGEKRGPEQAEIRAPHKSAIFKRQKK